MDPHLHLIDAIRTLQQRNWSCAIKHINREANTSADWMATHSEHLSLGFHEFNSPPGNLLPILLADAFRLEESRHM
ncbi:hypothetical protein REPUB_Repub01dG0018000 [Reevesia pubescens]